MGGPYGHGGMVNDHVDDPGYFSNHPFYSRSYFKRDGDESLMTKK